MSEREHRQRCLALRTLSSALAGHRVRSRLYGQVELGVRRRVTIDFRRRYDPLLSVLTRESDSEIQVRVHEDTFTWSRADGAPRAVPVADTERAAEEIIVCLGGHTRSGR
ncbi:hypothetical protein J4H86_17500 [Spiractinospora alimapuensis]|uniref:hypothetical protein n=1 Tax=Spiractinospora alimapuensis TaxID=2820884 RepID=UPI001F25F90F|nr:hypothetical protein [Spiractinospora alimapuensis]QVQ50679.1 hypothetical protein J4H86_17500 [Spiractinospora alimapuensis]